MISVNVEVIGDDRARLWLEEAPEKFHAALRESTIEGTSLEKQSIEAETPRRSGTLAGSIQSSVSEDLEGVEGKVFTNLRYAHFVELGTRRHGRAQHMFRHGGERVAPEVKQLFRNSTSQVTGSF